MRLDAAKGQTLTMSVQDIERAIQQLPAQEVEKLSVWLSDYHHQVWDKQIEDDLDSGRLDALLAEVDAEYEAGLSQLLLRLKR